MITITNVENQDAAAPYDFYDEYEAVFDHSGQTFKLIIGSYVDDWESQFHDSFEANQKILGHWFCMITQMHLADGTVFVSQSFGNGFKIVNSVEQAYEILASGDPIEQ
jgi:hypothetical protein